jgi:hypothetical protein
MSRFFKWSLRYEDNIKMNLREIGVVDLIHLALNRNQWRAIVNTAMNILNTQKARNVLVC